MFRIDSIGERDRLMKLIRRLDRVFLEHVAEKQKQKAAAAPA